MSTISHADQIHDQLLSRRYGQALDSIFRKFMETQKRMDEMTRAAFRNMLWAIALPGEDNKGAVFHVASVKTPAKASWGLFPRETHVASLFKEFLKNDGHLKSLDNGDNPTDILELGNRLKGALAKVPSVRESQSGRYSDSAAESIRIKPSGYYMASKSDQYNSYVDVPKAHRRSSFWKNAGASFLLGGVSRIAIMSALGTTATPALAAVVAGSVFAGAVTSYYRNRHLIAEEVANARENGAGFFGRLAARWRGFRKGYTVKQMAIGAGFSAVGFEFGGVAVDAITRHVPLGTLKDTFMNVAGNRIAQHADLAMGYAQSGIQYARAVNLGVATNALASVGSTANEWVFEPAREFLADNNIISRQSVEVARADITGGVVAATDTVSERMQETLEMVAHKNLPEHTPTGQKPLSDEAFNLRHADQPVVSRSLNTTTLDNTRHMNALEGKDVTAHSASKAADAFNALINPAEVAAVPPVEIAHIVVDMPKEGYEVIYPMKDDRLDKIVEAWYSVKPGEADFEKAMVAVIEENNYVDARVGFRENETIKMPTDIWAKPTVEQASLTRDMELPAAAADTAATILKQHDVTRGDTLWKLTRSVYGLTDPAARWDAIEKIVAANAGKYPSLLKDPTALTRGWELDMPDIKNPDVASADCRVVRGRARGCTLG